MYVLYFEIALVIIRLSPLMVVEIIMKYLISLVLICTSFSSVTKENTSWDFATLDTVGSVLNYYNDLASLVDPTLRMSPNDTKVTRTQDYIENLPIEELLLLEQSLNSMDLPEDSAGTVMNIKTVDELLYVMDDTNADFWTYEYDYPNQCHNIKFDTVTAADGIEYLMTLELYTLDEKRNECLDSLLYVQVMLLHSMTWQKEKQLGKETLKEIYDHVEKEGNYKNTIEGLFVSLHYNKDKTQVFTLMGD